MVKPESNEMKIVWWLMCTFCGIIILGGGAWATNISVKVEKVASLETNIALIQKDISSIKETVSHYMENSK